jgi:hypothetical protein
MPAVASVATKEGTRNFTWTIPLSVPKPRPARMATGKARSPTLGRSCARITLAREATDWIDRSMPPSRITKVTPVARMNNTAVLLSSSASVSPVRNPGAASSMRMTRTTSRAGGIAPWIQPASRKFLSE